MRNSVVWAAAILFSAAQFADGGCQSEQDAPGASVGGGLGSSSASTGTGDSKVTSGASTGSGSGVTSGSGATTTSGGSGDVTSGATSAPAEIVGHRVAGDRAAARSVMMSNPLRIELAGELTAKSGRPKRRSAPPPGSRIIATPAAGAAFPKAGSGRLVWLIRLIWLRRNGWEAEHDGLLGMGGSMGGSSGMAGSTNMAGAAGAGGAAPMDCSAAGLPAVIGGDGFATRYWDCCQTHCGQSDGHRCSQDGTSQDRQHERAPAHGGGSFACYDEAPHAVSDCLSYGYIAKANPNCGGCYRIQFTGEGKYNANDPGSKLIKGKQMIVKVSNTGGDVASNQFDLMIPGGGVGKFNACSKQWGTSDLGAQYGGFFTECTGAYSAKKECVARHVHEAPRPGRCATAASGSSTGSRPPTTRSSRLRRRTVPSEARRCVAGSRAGRQPQWRPPNDQNQRSSPSLLGQIHLLRRPAVQGSLHMKDHDNG